MKTWGRFAFLVVLLFLLFAGLVLALGSSPTAGVTTRVSVSSAGEEANGASFDYPAISADGRYVAFQSVATNLVPGGVTYGGVFVHDRQMGITSHVSVDSAGAQVNGGSEDPAISGDGRFVAFASYASNLVPGDTNDATDIFVHDRQTGSIVRVSVDSTGAQALGWSDSPSLSSDGRFVTFHSDAFNLALDNPSLWGGIFVHDRQTSATTLVSVNSDGTPGEGLSHSPVISADGRFVAFFSEAANLLLDDTNDLGDIIVHDRQTATTRRV